MKKILLSISIALSLVSCKSVLQVAHVEKNKNTNITDTIPSDKKVEAFILPYKTDLEKHMTVKLSYSPIELTKMGTNSHLGNLLADYMYEAGNEWLMKNHQKPADAALLNIGGIRNSIDKGDILVRNIFEVMPFENEVILVKFKGKDLEGLFQYYEKTQKNNPVSKLNIEVKDGKLTKAWVNGQPVHPEQDYYIVTSDYLALGGDNMSFFSKGEHIATGIKLRDVFLEKFKANHPLKFGEVEQRLLFQNNTK